MRIISHVFLCYNEALHNAAFKVSEAKQKIVSLINKENIYNRFILNQSACIAFPTFAVTVAQRQTDLQQQQQQQQ